MALQMEMTAEGLAKFRSAMETGNLVTLKNAELYGGFSDGSVSGEKLATMTVISSKALDTNSNVYRFTCQDRNAGAYTAYSGKILDADGVVVAIFHNNGDKVATKEEKAEVLIGCEFHFEDSVKVSDVVNMGDVSFYFNPDEATTEVKGVVELATEAEAKAGTDTKRAITPKTLDVVIEGHDNIVHRSGDESISDKKTFLGVTTHKADLNFTTTTKTDLTKESTVDEHWVGDRFVDSNGVKGAQCQYYRKSNGDAEINMQVKAKSNNGFSVLALVQTKDGKSYAIAPTPDTGDNSSKIATTVWVNEVAAKYLPLAGGKMTGTIRSTLEGLIVGDTDTSAVRISGGTNWDSGASLVVCGKDHATYPGMFRIKAEDGTNEYVLLGKPDGTLTWGGKNVVRSVGGVAADAAGNVNLGDVLRVVASWSNGGFWYRKYSDGWIEQGGIVGVQSWLNNPTVQLNTNMPFTNTNYTVIVSAYNSKGGKDSGTSFSPCVNTKTTSSFNVDYSNSTDMGLIWYACGY